MTRIAGCRGLFVLLCCATPLVAQRSTRRVIDRAGIAAAGWHRVGEVVDALPPGSTASVEGFNSEIRGSRLGFFETTEVRASWLVRLNGQPMPMHVAGLWILDAVPVSMAQIDSIVINEGPRLSDGRAVFLGTIDLYTRFARRGPSVVGTYQHGDEAGDPGPYRYTTPSAPNVEKVGPFVEGAAALAGDRAALDFGARYFSINTTDENLIARLGPLFPQFQSDVNASGGSGVATLDVLGGRTYIIGGRGRFTGLMPLPMDSTNQQHRVVTSEGGLSGSVSAAGRQWRYQASATELEIQSLGRLSGLGGQKRLMIDAFVETAVDRMNIGIGGTAARQEATLDARRNDTRRAWANYTVSGLTFGLAGEYAAGRMRLSSSAGFEKVRADSTIVSIRLQSLEGWRAAMSWMDDAREDSSDMTVTDLRGEITTTALLGVRPTWYARGFVFERATSARRVSGIAGGVVVAKQGARVVARARAELTQLLGDAEVGESSTPPGFIEGTVSARATGGFDLALLARFAPATHWSGLTVSEDIPATRRIDFSANKSLWKDRIRAQLVMRNLLLTPEWNHPRAAHWNLRTHLGATVALPSGASGR
jgi:hypothetical protein